MDSQNPWVWKAGGRARCWTNRSKVSQAGPGELVAHHEVGE